MTLAEYMGYRGWVLPGRDLGSKCMCPFHNDRSPSAILNANNIFCFSEQRVYGLRDFEQAFGVILEPAADSSSVQTSRLRGDFKYEAGEVLFTMEEWD